jgi:hypothetical protein
VINLKHDPLGSGDDQPKLARGVTCSPILFQKRSGMAFPSGNFLVLFSRTWEPLLTLNQQPLRDKIEKLGDYTHTLLLYCLSKFISRFRGETLIAAYYFSIQLSFAWPYLP